MAFEIIEGYHFAILLLNLPSKLTGPENNNFRVLFFLCVKMRGL
jgi:hypothetical protein